MNSNSDLRIKIIISTLVTLLIGGTVAFKILEPFTWIQAFYFTTITMTTVGFGDLVPSNDLTRLIVAIFVIVSVTLYVSLATYLGANYLKRREQIEKQKIDKDEKT